jgi:hypothetical protein
VETIDLDALPGDDNLEIRSIEQSPTGTVLRLETRDSIGDVVDEIRTRLETVSSRV